MSNSHQTTPLTKEWQLIITLVCPTLIITLLQSLARLWSPRECLKDQENALPVIHNVSTHCPVILIYLIYASDKGWIIEEADQADQPYEHPKNLIAYKYLYKIVYN